MPPVRIIEGPPEEEPKKYSFTLTKKQLSGLYGPAAEHPIVAGTQFRFK